MDEHLQNEAKQVVKRVTEWKWLRIHEDVKELLGLKSTSASVHVNFCKTFLMTSGKSLANGFEIKLVQQTGLQQLVKAVQACHELLLMQEIHVNSENLQVLKSLYHILHIVLPHDRSLGQSVSDQLTKELKIHIKRSPAGVDLPKDVTAILQNAYLLLWNRAQAFDQDVKQANNNVHALNMRLKALHFLYMVPTECVRFCEQATRAAKNYQKFIKSNPCPHMENFYKKIFSLIQEMKIQKCESILKSITPKLLKESFNFLISWINYLIPTSTLQAEKCITMANMSVFDDFTKSLPRNCKLPQIVSFCTDILLISTHLGQISSERKLPLSTDLKKLLKKRPSFDKIPEEFLVLWDTCCSLFYGQLRDVLNKVQVNPEITTSLHLKDLNSMIVHIAAVRNANPSEITYAMSHTLTVGDLGFYCSFYQVLLSICAIALGHYDETNVQFSATRKVALEIANQFSHLVKDCHHSYGSHYVINVWAVGSKCYTKELYSKALEFYKTCFKFIKKSFMDGDSEEIFKSNFQYVKFVTVCFCNAEDYFGALDFLAEMLSVNYKSSKGFLEQWVKVKRDAKAYFESDKILTTTVKHVLTFAPKFKRKDLVSLLMREFEMYRNNDAQEEKIAVMKELLDEEILLDNFSKAVVLIDYAELQLVTDVNPDRSPRTCCNEAIKLLENLDAKQYRKPFPSEKDCWLAHAFFVLHLYETRENQAASEDEVISQTSAVAAAAAAATTSKRKSGEACSSCNVPPTYLHITMEVEFNSLFYLDKSLDMWTAIVGTKPGNIANSVTAINDLKTMAEMYSLVRMVSREVQAWRLVLQVAKTFSNIVERGSAVSRLVTLLSRNGLTREASAILQEFKPLITELKCKSESKPFCKRSQHVIMCLVLAESELLLMKNQVREGFEYLRTAYKNMTSCTSSVLTSLVQCEANLLLSRFCELPSSVLKLTSDTEDSPIILATRSLSSCLELVKSVINRKDFKLYRCMELKPRLINLLMECALRVGYLFQDIGAPRESSCFLKEQLLWAQKLSLANRSAELLLALGKLDIISERYDDCLSKLHGVQFIIECPGKELQLKPDVLPVYPDSAASCENMADDYVDLVSPCFSRKCVAQQSDGDKTSSPAMKNRTIFLNWQQHSTSCLCTKCKQLVFHRLRLELACAQTECHFYALDKLGASKAMESMSTILRYAETWRTIEQSLLLEMISNTGTDKGSNYVSGDRPLLQLDIITCIALCKLTQMRLSNEDLPRAHLAIKSAYYKVCKLVHTGLAQIHYLMANVIYFYCVVKMNVFASSMGLSVSQYLNQNFWSSSEAASSESVDTEDIDFLTAKVDNVHIVGTELADCFKTPRSVAAPSSKYNARNIKNAPVKRVPTLSAFENRFSDSDLQVLTPVKVTTSKKNLLKNKKNTKSLANLETKCGENLEVTNDMATSEKGITTKGAIYSKLFTKANKENSDAEIRSPVKKVTTVRSVLGSFGNDNSENVTKTEEAEKPALNLCYSSSPNTQGSPFISATKIRKCPRACRAKSKVSSTSSSGRIPTETVRRSLRNKARTLHSETVSSSPVIAEITRCNDFDEVPVFTSEIISPSVLPFDDFQDVPETADKASRTNNTAATKAVHLLINELETLRASSPMVLTTEKTLKHKVNSSGKKMLGNSKKNNLDFSIDRVIMLLEKAVNLMYHHPHMPLYYDLNMLLILCKGENDKSKAVHIFESMALTLRHQANYILAAKLSKKNKSEEVSNNPNVDNLRLNERKSILAFPRNIGDWNTSVSSISSKISKGWTVCQINVVPSLLQNKSYKNGNPDLIITRLQQGRSPLIVKTISKSSMGGVINFNTEFDNIVQESAVGARLTDRSLWWSSRREVDNRLKALVKSIEDYWLGHWKGLLLANPSHEDDQERLKEATSSLAKEIRSKGLEAFDENMLEVIVNSFVFMKDSHSRQALAEMLCLSCDDNRIKELCTVFKKKCASLCSNIIERQHVILILDKKLHKFPWENMPILCSAPVSRMPSIHFLLGHLALYGNSNSRVTVDTSKTFYILNPGNDLPATEKRLSTTFSCLNWNGVTGRPPTLEEWSSALSECDLFLYNGHGSGNQFMSLHNIQKSACRASVFLIGCSSGKLRSQGRRLELDGIVLHYLLAGSPSVLGNLWDVTDRAIDQFLEDMLKYWLPETGQTESSLCRAIISARANCNLLFAIGAAPVVYGIPIQSKKR